MRFPSQLHVFVRDWLSSNNVLLKSRDGHVLIDSGYVRHAPLMLALLRTSSGIGEDPLALLVNTHCHSDHMGGNASVAQRYACPIAIPEGEVPLIERWDEQALLLAYADQQADRFEIGEVLRAGETRVWGDLEWQLIAAPGHDMGALVFFNPEHGILISGDALWRRGFGFVMPHELDAAALPAARATLDTLAALPVRTVIPGHGDPFEDVAPALEYAYARLERYERDPQGLARHAIKVLIAFSVLEKQGLRLAELPDYLDRVGILRDFNARFLRTPPTILADWVAGELVRAGVARAVDGWLRPA